MIVMKFGGTSNQDAAAMSNVISIVKSHLPEQPVVVISAIARATNELEQTARTAALGNKTQAEALLNGLFNRHNTIIESLITSADIVAQLKATFAQYLAELKQLVNGVTILRELTPRTMDAFCSYGERLSSRLIAAGLQESGVDAVWIDAKDFMVTDDDFGRAQPLTDLVASNLEKVVRPMVKQMKVPVTQGFIGVTQSGAYTTMGRESSDYSASIIGAAMNAERVQIWTDVDGILTADPNVVKETRKVKRMSFEEAFELSFFGAKVLHPNTMLPVLEKKIPVQILNSRHKDGSGTLVDVDSVSTDGRTIIKSIAFKKGLSIITVTPHKRFSQYLFWEGIFSVLTRYGITTGMMTTSEYNISFTVENKMIAEGLSHDLQEFGRVDVHGSKASLCLVGTGMRGSAGLMNRIFDALSSMNIMMVSYGASSLNLALVIDEQQIPEALRRLHKEFFERTEVGEAFESIAR